MFDRHSQTTYDRRQKTELKTRGRAENHHNCQNQGVKVVSDWKKKILTWSVVKRARIQAFRLLEEWPDIC